MMVLQLKCVYFALVNTKWYTAVWGLYQGATEVTGGFVPDLGVAIFTHTNVVHKSIAVDKALP